MSDPVSLYIVTDRAEQAAQRFFYCRVASLPDWVQVATSIIEIEEIPNGTSVLTHFAAGGRSTAEQVWFERRLRGGLFYDHEALREKIEVWLDKRLEYERKLLAQHSQDHERQGNYA